MSRWVPKYKVGDILNWKSQNQNVDYRPEYKSIKIDEVTETHYHFLDNENVPLGSFEGPTIDKVATLVTKEEGGGKANRRKSRKSRRVKKFKRRNGRKSRKH